MSNKKKAAPSASARGASKRDKDRAHSDKGQEVAPSPDRTPTPATKKSKPKGKLGVPGSKDPSRRCTATANRTGKRCGAPAIKGGTVCRMHGGSLPQVKAKAKERLLALVDPALAALHEVLTNPKADDSTKVRAALGILDRTGHGPGAKIEIGGPSAFDQVAMEALEVDRSTSSDEKPALERPTHTWEDVDQFQKDAQGDAWRALEHEDDADLKPPEAFDGPVVQGEVVSSIFPAPPEVPDETEISGGREYRRKRQPTDPPAYWEE